MFQSMITKNGGELNTSYGRVIFVFFLIQCMYNPIIVGI